MQMNTLSDDYTVSPQIDVSDVPSIAQAGFKSVICNRPDQENPAPRHIEAIKAAVQAACSIVWAFAQAGRIATDDILDATARAGYQLAHLRPQLEMLALNRAED